MDTTFGRFCEELLPLAEIALTPLNTTNASMRIVSTVQWKTIL
jgi:hypothetical protein